jgi:hypothetical protein
MKKKLLLAAVWLAPFILNADQVIPEGNKGPAYLYPANPGDRLYRLPLTKGKTFPITDGYWSDPNQVNHEDYSLDWTMPSMEPILCARGGRVLSVVCKDSVCVIKGSEGNYVVIGHVDSVPDASRPSGFRKLWIRDWYQHLHYNIPVKLGDVVAQGQVIGYNWCSGKSEEGPHLHFEVNMDGHEGVGLGGRTIRSIPVPFVEVNRHNGFPEVGETYYSQNEISLTIQTENRLFSSDIISVHPNPFNPAVNISIARSQQDRGELPSPTPRLGSRFFCSVAIYDINGRSILKKNLLKPNFTWNAKDLSSGPYIVKVNMEDKTFQKRIIFQK